MIIYDTSLVTCKHYLACFACEPQNYLSFGNLFSLYVCSYIVTDKNVKSVPVNESFEVPKTVASMDPI